VQIEVCKLKSNSYHSVSIGILNLYPVLFYLVQWRNLILQKVALSWMVLKFVWHLGQFGSSLFLNLVEGNGPFLLLVLSWLCFFFKPAPLYILDEVSLNIIYYSNSLPLPFSLFIWWLKLILKNRQHGAADIPHHCHRKSFGRAHFCLCTFQLSTKFQCSFQLSFSAPFSKVSVFISVKY